ncbi:hypothetical protein J2X01_002673 [Arthrobacter ginsengisoli]|uniref:Uncharacterized protein n=1 Tax=Arthrobacter ginsengisoli TaxID=1356565 RepID=A0ABU1UDV7_9MICC|nr:hypothetical protein [Arthrobacter ginsengisoli]MDR7083379.1 hypothetical protein [Arthrobacter ginsengisoli]
MHVISDFRVKDKAELHEKLDAAVTAAQSDALADGAGGVLVTRHDFSHFSVTLSPDVPFGLIHEDDQASRN